MGTFNLALIGGGGIARAHVRAANEIGSDLVRVVAVAEPVIEARAAIADAAGGAKTFDSLSSLLADTAVSGTIHGVIVCTPPFVRIPIVQAILERGIPLMVEKPLAHTLADARLLADLASRHPKVPTAVGYCHRFTPAFVEMKKRIAAGELGNLVRFENIFAGWNPTMQTHWMSDPATNGGSFSDTGCHSLDLFRYLIGEGEVKAAALHHEWPRRGDSNATVFLESSSIAGVIFSGWAEADRWTVTVVGSKGTLAFDFEKPEQLEWRPVGSSSQTFKVDSADLRFRRQLQAFVNLARGEGRGEIASFRDGLATAALVDQALKIAGR